MGARNAEALGVCAGGGDVFSFRFGDGGVLEDVVEADLAAAGCGDDEGVCCWTEGSSFGEDDHFVFLSFLVEYKRRESVVRN